MAAQSRLARPEAGPKGFGPGSFRAGDLSLSRHKLAWARPQMHTCWKLQQVDVHLPVVGVQLIHFAQVLENARIVDVPANTIDSPLAHEPTGNIGVSLVVLVGVLELNGDAKLGRHE